MRFGLAPVEEAIGAIAAHSVRADGTTVKKGTLISPEIAMQLKQAGVETMIAARFEPGDVGEDEAAWRLAQSLAGESVAVEAPFTGRSNLYAAVSGVLLIGVDAINRLNAVDEAITFAVGEGLTVMYVTEDTTRSDPDTLRRLFTPAIRAICLLPLLPD